MAVRFKVDMRGLENFLEAIQADGQNLEAAVDAALAAGGDVILAGMLQRVPKDTHNLEAHLERTEPQQDGNLHFVEIGLAQDTDADTARYGNAQEYGTSSMAAQPYIRPAFDEDGKRARAAMRQALLERGGA